VYCVNLLGQTVDERAEQHALLFERSFSLSALTPLARLGQRAIDHCRQSLQAIFEHVVGRAALQRLDRALFAERARDEQERRVGTALERDPERLQPVESGERIVSENQMRLARERASEIALRHGEPPLDG